MVLSSAQQKLVSKLRTQERLLLVVADIPRAMSLTV